MSAKTLSVRIIAAVIIAVVVVAVPLVVSGQPQIRRGMPVAQAPAPEQVRLSSGPFVLPSNAAMFDWVVLNGSTTAQTVNVTVFELGGGAKKAMPGTLPHSVPPNGSIHWKNAVGEKAPFHTGVYYEIVVEGNSPNLLPSVYVASSDAYVAVPGTLIPSGSWVRLQ